MLAICGFINSNILNISANTLINIPVVAWILYVLPALTFSKALLVPLNTSVKIKPKTALMFTASMIVAWLVLFYMFGVIWHYLSRSTEIIRYSCNGFISGFVVFYVYSFFLMGRYNFTYAVLCGASGVVSFLLAYLQKGTGFMPISLMLFLYWQLSVGLLLYYSYRESISDKSIGG